MKRVALGAKTPTQDNDQKLTQATWMALNLFLLFVVPVTFLGAVSPFLEQPYPMSYDVLSDISYLLFYMNNVVNPFAYYVFLKDFKEGYQLMLCCKKNSRNTNGSITSYPSVKLSTTEDFCCILNTNAVLCFDFSRLIEVWS